MFVPLLLDLVRVKDRPEIFLVFGLDRAKKTADLLCRIGHRRAWHPLDHSRGCGGESGKLTGRSSGELAHQARFLVRADRSAVI